MSLRRKGSELGRAVSSAAKDRSQDEATVAWVRARRDFLQWVGAGIGVLALLLLDLSWLGLLVLLALIAAYEVAVVRLTAEPVEDPTADAR